MREKLNVIRQGNPCEGLFFTRIAGQFPLAVIGDVLWKKVGKEALALC